MENSSPSLPPEAGKIVGILELKGNLIVACEHRVYQLDGEQFAPMTFINEPASQQAKQAKSAARNVGKSRIWTL